MAGAFECRVDVLSWRPANGIDPDRCRIELLGQDSEPIGCALSPLPGEGGARRYQISGTQERPAFARVTLPDGSFSLPSIVALVDHLRAMIRETRSRKVENALRDLDSETEARLSLLEVLDVLEKLDAEDAAAHDAVSIPKRCIAKDGDPGAPEYRILNYEQFIAGRRPHTEVSPLVHNSLAGSEASLVRGFLNRIVGTRAEAGEHDGDDDEGALAGAFDLADETSDAEAAMAAGAEFDSKKGAAAADQEAEAKRKAAQRKATKEEILTATAAFARRVRERQQNGALDSRDILRLRALLMILCGASWSAGGDAARPPASLQVLTGDGGQDSWPFVIGRLLFSFFGGRDPAIRQLCLSSEHDQIPADIKECWATCYWCFQACLQAPVSAPEKKRIGQHIKLLAVPTYQLTLPSKAELLGDDVIALMDGMSARYAGSMGVNPAAMREAHRTLASELFGRQG
jgi:hypothetical protein